MASKKELKKRIKKLKARVAELEASQAPSVIPTPTTPYPGAGINWVYDGPPVQVIYKHAETTEGQ